MLFIVKNKQNTHTHTWTKTTLNKFMMKKLLNAFIFPRFMFQLSPSKVLFLWFVSKSVAARTCPANKIYTGMYIHINPHVLWWVCKDVQICSAISNPKYGGSKPGVFSAEAGHSQSMPWGRGMMGILQFWGLGLLVGLLHPAQPPQPWPPHQLQLLAVGLTLMVR